MKTLAIIGQAPGSIGYNLYLKMKARMYLPKFDVRYWNEIWKWFTEHSNELDGMVYAAGIYKYGKVKNLNINDWYKIIDVNLTGAMMCVKAYLQTQGHGTIILIGANAAHVPSAGSSAYCVSKAGMSMLTQVVAQEVGSEYNIVQIDPGIVKDTNMYYETAKNMGVSEEEMLEKRLKNVPAGRCMTKDELRDWVQFIIDKGSYINGVNLKVDGGKIIASRKDELNE